MSTDDQPGNAGSSGELAISYDDCFDLLRNHRRRYTLHYLQDNDGVATLGDLSDQIAAWENDIPPEEVSYDERKRVYTSLQQVHLPRMDRMNVIEFDDREGTIELGPGANDLDVYLGLGEKDDVPWSLFYLGLAAFNLLVLGAVLLGVPSIDTLPAVMVGAFAVATFLITSLVHFYATRTELQFETSDKPPELAD
ncbi:hypothetical protein BRC65_03870 [Halobacteriales archaeon QH_2_65_14]|nr:MAG: hypothetical protein BRC65_03870 [Halobacteriales archaeon QH_2_65_14]